MGIMAIAVALLMIGGEFDLSTGVLTGSTAPGHRASPSPS
jgi:simple sugar transport system permease protein